MSSNNRSQANWTKPGKKYLKEKGAAFFGRTVSARFPAAAIILTAAQVFLLAFAFVTGGLRLPALCSAAAATFLLLADLTVNEIKLQRIYSSLIKKGGETEDFESERLLEKKFMIYFFAALLTSSSLMIAYFCRAIYSASSGLPFDSLLIYCAFVTAFPQIYMLYTHLNEKKWDKPCVFLENESRVALGGALVPFEAFEGFSPSIDDSFEWRAGETVIATGNLFHFDMKRLKRTLREMKIIGPDKASGKNKRRQARIKNYLKRRLGRR